MTNKEWLEICKNFDKTSGVIQEKDSEILVPGTFMTNEFRQTKALEIIAEELITLNKSFKEVMEISKPYIKLLKFPWEEKEQK